MCALTTDRIIDNDGETVAIHQRLAEITTKHPRGFMALGNIGKTQCK